LPRTGIRG